MIRIIVACLLILVVGVSNAEAAGGPKMAGVTIRLYNWWDYIVPDVLNRLKESGFNTSVTEYRSNEIALTRLATKRDDFDVAIVSNFALPYLRAKGLIETDQFVEIAESRQYMPLFKETAQQCLPYLWSTTVFVSKVGPAPKTLKDLTALKKDGVKIGVVDDMYETAARVIGDSPSMCGHSPDAFLNKNIFDLVGACPKNYSLPREGLSSSDFVSSITELLKQPRVAVYDWHGEALADVDKYPSLKVSLPKTRPTVGYDVVCIIKRPNRNVPLKSLVRFVELATDKTNTEFNVSSNQYFSPYAGHTTGLKPATQRLYSELSDRLSRETPITIRPPAKDVHERLNNWWKTIRYEP